MRTYYIAGSWNSWQPEEMTWSLGRWQMASAAVGRGPWVGLPPFVKEDGSKTRHTQDIPRVKGCYMMQLSRNPSCGVLYSSVQGGSLNGSGGSCPEIGRAMTLIHVVWLLFDNYMVLEYSWDACQSFFHIFPITGHQHEETSRS